MKRAALTCILLAALTASAQRPGLYVRRGVHDGVYYGRATMVDLRTLEILPYDPRPAAPIPDPALLTRDLDTARRIAADRFGLKLPDPEPRSRPAGLFAILAACALSLGSIFFVARIRPQNS